MNKLLTVLFVAILFAAVQAKTEKVGQNACPLCEFVVQTVESYLTNNATQAEIIHEVEQICLIFGKGSPIYVQCETMIEQYGPSLINALVAKEPPHIFCTQVGLCSSTEMGKIIKKISLNVDVKDNSLCPVCTLVVSAVEQWMESNATVTQIIAQAEQLCKLFGGGFEQQCDAFVEQYVPQLVTWIEKNEPPSVFCKQVGLCSSSQQKIAKLARILKSENYRKQMLN
eukprot:TRINITY_DN11197_c0_g1_i1.p1 TRINITY_DN11197_c0_g1~~TRINITY_DN11197_c0_g1_i1.p1  ORF type:complete len:227 (-),score=50.28 TRINITY_DN11197_c0_g1_i1:33-713(-)